MKYIVVVVLMIQKCKGKNCIDIEVWSWDHIVHPWIQCVGDTVCGGYSVWRIQCVEDTVCGGYNVWRIQCVEDTVCGGFSKWKNISLVFFYVKI